MDSIWEVVSGCMWFSNATTVKAQLTGDVIGMMRDWLMRPST